MAQHEDHPGRKIARLERKVAGLQAGQRTVAQLSRIVLHKLEIEVAAAREQRDLAEAMLEQAYAAAFGSIARSEGMGAEDIGAELALAGQMLNAACDRLDELGYRWDAEGGWVLREPADDDASPHALASARRTLLHLRYTFHGGQQWKPPIGKPPAWLADEPDAPAVEAIGDLVSSDQPKGKPIISRDDPAAGFNRWICKCKFGEGLAAMTFFGRGRTPEEAYEKMWGHYRNHYINAHKTQKETTL